MTSEAEKEKIKEIISRQEYKGGLPYGLRALDHSNQAVTVATFFFVLYTRSLCAAYFGAGALGCVGMVKVLKRVLREKRPVGTTYKVTYGMPSTHSATITYYATFITLAASNLPVHSSLSLLPRFVIYPLAPMLATGTAAVICTSRLRLGHHTLKQVAVGVTVGVFCGGAWFWWWAKSFAPALAWHFVELLPISISSLVR